MGQVRRVLTPQASPLHLWGAELRALRDRMGVSLAKLGAEIYYDPSHLGKFERAERVPPRRIAEACDRHLGGAGQLVRLWEAIQAAYPADRGAAERGRHEANRGQDEAKPGDRLAAAAEDQPVWGEGEDTVSVPVLHDGKVIFVSISRRALLTLAGTAVSLTAAGAVPISSTTRPEAQAPLPVAPDMNPLEHFGEMRRVLVDSDNLFGPRAVIPAVEQQIQIMQRLRAVTEHGDRQRLIQMQVTYGEFAGWLHQDAGQLTAAEYWTDRALEWSHAGGDPDLITYVLARKAQLAGDLGDAVQAIGLGQAAEAAARPGTRLAAIAATFGAHGHALMRDASACTAAYDRAHHLVDTTNLDPTSPWGAWLDHAHIDLHRARSLATLGRAHQDGTSRSGTHAGTALMRQAADSFATAIKRLPAGYHRDRGMYLARQAAAETGAREPEHAAEVAMQALTVGTQTGSARILTELGRVDRELAGWRSLPPVATFHDALAGSTR